MALTRLSSLTQDAAGTADDLANGFAYNPASQIASETTTNAAYDWTHPANFTNAYASDLLNKYVTAAGATLTHDSRGNLTFDGAKTFAYDADQVRGRLPRTVSLRSPGPPVEFIASGLSKTPYLGVLQTGHRPTCT